MRVPAQEMAERAAVWAGSDPAVRAAAVYGSVAQGSADGESDLDLVIVPERTRRERPRSPLAPAIAARLGHELE